MREHQVIISLKTEQFEELQRMARAAGSRSLSGFARQRLLQSLGIGAGKTGTEQAGAGVDIKELTQELRRLHRDLKVFVAESLAAGDYPLLPLTDPHALGQAIPVVEENFLTDGVPLLPVTDYGAHDISLNPSAQVNPYGTGQSVPRYPLTQGRLPIPGYPSRLDGIARLPVLPNQADQAPDSGSDRDASQAATDGAEATSSQQSPTRAADDELEELAERAFAISPRLGALEPKVKPQQAVAFPDPLKDLLDDVLMSNRSGSDEDEAPGDSTDDADSDSYPYVDSEGESFGYQADEPEGEKEQEFSEVEEASPDDLGVEDLPAQERGGDAEEDPDYNEDLDYNEAPDYSEDPDYEARSDEDEQQVDDDQDQADEDQADEDQADEDQADEDQADEDQADEDDDQPPSRPSQPPPPIPPLSGGPPPRKRSR